MGKQVKPSKASTMRAQKAARREDTKWGKQGRMTAQQAAQRDSSRRGGLGRFLRG